MKVAVVIPCHNVAALVEGAVRSVWDQQGVDPDIVAVDDGSTDGTGQVLARLASERPGKLKVITQNNAGACVARQRGLAEVDGAYVQFLDADDRLMTGKIRGQLQLAHVTGEPAIIVGGYRNTWSDGREYTVLPLETKPWAAWVGGTMGTTSANLWNRKALVSVGGWNKDQLSSQDYELAFRLLRAGHTIAVDRTVATWITKRSSGSISTRDQAGNLDRYIKLRADVREHLKSVDAVGFRDEIATVEQHLFMAIRILYRMDRARALQLLEALLPGDFRPRRQPGLSTSYCLVHRLFGFGMAERIAMAIGNLRRIRSAHDQLP
jgi:glycosyltransferase involved in cell wall biosynthesis